MEEIMLKIENVSKEYKLGQIGGTTLRDELQRRSAKRRGLEDPTRKIGAREYTDGETFMALDGVSFEVRKGERVGIIGHNGAGKSTLLKLISRITAPTGGSIYLNGRVASMLEVGTGFHGELTGRENIYMNGAILGMAKKEIDAKIENIIDFSEVRQFIDTPVKRYSSGMYVKLAFSVAAHLDSEIMIMDEVLAVGDMAFQTKCLEKMSDVSRTEGRTILYVSHNMNTIRQLCDRVVVLDHGKVVFDGGVEEGIGVYMGSGKAELLYYKYTEEHHTHKAATGEMGFNELTILNTDKTVHELNEDLDIQIRYSAKQIIKNVMFHARISCNGSPVGTMFSDTPIDLNAGENQQLRMKIHLNHLMGGHYRVDLLSFVYNEYGKRQVLDAVFPAFFFDIDGSTTKESPVVWTPQYWSQIRLDDMETCSFE